MGVSLGVAPQLLALSFTNLILMMEVIEDYASNVCEESDAERWSDAIIKASWYYCVSYKGSPKDRPHVNHELGNWLDQTSSRNLWPYKRYFTFHAAKKNTVADRILRNATAGRNFFLAGTHHPFYVMEPWELKNMVSRCTSRQYEKDRIARAASVFFQETANN